MDEIARNFQEIRARIEKAARDARRHRALDGGRHGAGLKNWLGSGRAANDDDVRLIAVSKMQPDAHIDAALNAGHRLFGENKVQEAKLHWEARRALYPDLRLHLIGPLQTNKVREAVTLFDCIETIDRVKLVDALAEEMTRQGRALECMIQVNTGEEPQKAGVLPQDLPALLAHCRGAGVSVTGLMCIPPVGEASALHFLFLKELAQRHHLQELSMGMSEDFEKAILAGATYVRVGSALFGARPV